MGKIRIAIVGVGNCASSLVQGIEHYRQTEQNGNADGLGLMHLQLGPYRPSDIEVVAAFDVDQRKVGKPLNEAIFAPPNCTKEIMRDFVTPGPLVQMGPVLDGISTHMADYPDTQAFRAADADPVDIVKVLQDSQADILINYLPVGSQQATETYAAAALQAGVSLVNCIPVFIVSEPTWAQKFTDKGIPCIGDDIKAQVGATIVHRVLTKLFEDRGVQLDATYQLNTGGNTDFLNMLNHKRLCSKKVSKTEAVQSQLKHRLDDDQVHIGPADYVPWQKDNKVCFLRMEGRGFAGMGLNLELRLSVEDSPNSAGVAIDAIRCCKLARDRGLAGPIEPVSAYLMKHPPVQMTDDDAHRLVEDFIANREHSDIAAPPVGGSRKRQTVS